MIPLWCGDHDRVPDNFAPSRTAGGTTIRPPGREMARQGLVITALAAYPAQMTQLAITGHRGLSDVVEAEVDRMIRAAVAENGDLVGVSCLADGADAVFAQAVLDVGGALVAVLPASEVPRLVAGGVPARLRRVARAGGQGRAAAVRHARSGGVHGGGQADGRRVRLAAAPCGTACLAVGTAAPRTWSPTRGRGVCRSLFFGPRARSAEHLPSSTGTARLAGTGPPGGRPSARPG